MTQEPNRPSSSSKRPSRPARNRPVLVNTALTGNDTVRDDISQADPPVSDNTRLVKEAPTVATSVAPATPAARTRRLPGFFSSVGKSEADKTALETNQQAQARLARATRGKISTAPAKVSTAAEKTEEVKQAAAKPTTSKAGTAPARPKSGFKLRYIYGMVLYLIAADFIGVAETNYIQSNHFESLIAQLGPVRITTSTLAYLATLVVILLILAYFDLLPRSLGAMSGQQPAQKGKTGSSQTTVEGTKSQRPTMRQGVQGADDDLYQEYRDIQRYNQKRARKK